MTSKGDIIKMPIKLDNKPQIFIHLHLDCYYFYYSVPVLLRYVYMNFAFDYIKETALSHNYRY